MKQFFIFPFLFDDKLISLHPCAAGIMTIRWMCYELSKKKDHPSK
jgi:hypothetical protein